MEKNIGDQLNKAFEAYRQVTIEKDNAKRDLEQMVTTREEGLSPTLKCAKLYQYSKIISVFSCCFGSQPDSNKSVIVDLFTHFYRVNTMSDILRNFKSRSRTSSS